MKQVKRIIVLTIAVVCLFALALTANAQNPYMDLWEHVPDGEPHVFGDRVYVYGSHDVFESRMCGPNYVVWSAPVDDLTDWTYHGISFDGGESGYLLAPDVCQGPDGKYYLYTFGDCDQGGRGQTFVAVSEQPEGPFEYLGPVLVDGKPKMIFDPAVLVDDDGSVYLFGGASNIYKLDPEDMRTAIEGPYQVQELNDKGELVQIRDFQEGSSIRKVGDWYVFVYAAKYDLNTSNWCTNNTNNSNYYNGTLQYGYSREIYGPYTYGGVIIDNGGEILKPSENTFERSYYNGNTHGGIVEAQEDEWYVFYHRQSNATQTYRQAMCEPLELSYDDQGVYIKQAEMTSQGAEKNGLNPEKEYSAGITCYLTRGAYVHTDVEMYDPITPVVNIKNSVTVGYKYFNFEGKNYDLKLNLKTLGLAGKLGVCLDTPNSEPIALLDIPATAQYETLNAKLGKISGKHAVFFNFYAASQAEICEFISFTFDKDAQPLAFTDVQDASQYYHVPVYWAVENKITNGMSATSFGPEKTCTRAQIVTCLWRAAGEPKPANTSTAFTDLDAEEYYYDAVLWAVEEGIVNGLTSSAFGPERTCTRAQIVTFLWRYAGEPEAQAELSFTDLDSDAYYVDAVAWAVENGVTAGLTETTFGPEKTCTRAQVVTFLYRATNP